MIVTEQTKKPVTRTPAAAPNWEVIEGEPRMVLNVSRVMTDEMFDLLCADNDIMRLELSAAGELIIMTPTKMRTGRKNASLTGQLIDWAERNGSGVCFDSSTIFNLPNKAKRSPDASWAQRERWDALVFVDGKPDPVFCPDFVVELRSESDRLKPLEAKMAEWIANGARLAWLIDPIQKRVSIYRPDAECEVITCEQLRRLDGQEILAADPPILPGFVLDLREIW